MTLTIHASARSMTGRRSRNEDTYLVDPDSQVFAVLDGMGGQAGGDIASSVAAEAIADFYHSIANDPEATWPYALALDRTMIENQIDAAIRLANRKVRARRSEGLGSMGTTIASLALSHAREGVRGEGTRGEGGKQGARLAVLAHVGDSRVYLLRGGQLTQLTRDHSLYELLLADGVALPPLAEFPHANVITRALGSTEDERPELSRMELVAGDRFLLCTDGLSGDLEPSIIARILAHGTVDEAAEALVDAAFEAGSRDNITAVVVEAG